MLKNKIRILLGLFVFLMALPVFAQNHFELGKKEYYKENYFEAQKLFLKELQQNSENYPCRYFLAHTYVHTGNINRAKEEYSKIITFSPVPAIQKLAMQSLYNLNTVKSEKNFQLIHNSGDDYYAYIKLQGNYVKWGAFPINVYVSPSDKSVAIKNAFMQWEKVTNKLVSFNFVGNVAAAQITVSTVDNLSVPYTAGYEAGLASVNAKNNVIYKSHIDILNVNPDTAEPFSDDFVLTTTMHEIGHALGIQGHSPDENDLMAAVNKKGVKSITKRDLNTLKRLYRAL